MKTSARNHFEGTIDHVREGALNDEIALAVADGVRIVATVTRESRERLGLRVGAPAFALVKASSILLVCHHDDVLLSARNQLTGEVVEVTPGAVNTEVVLQLPGSTSVVAIITNDSAMNLGVAVGLSATALFKAGSVVIGVRKT